MRYKVGSEVYEPRTSFSTLTCPKCGKVQGKMSPKFVSESGKSRCGECLRKEAHK